MLKEIRSILFLPEDIIFGCFLFVFRAVASKRQKVGTKKNNVYRMVFVVVMMYRNTDSCLPFVTPLSTLLHPREVVGSEVMFFLAPSRSRHRRAGHFHHHPRRR